ncbi:hypothetical protein V6N13_076266 [Hibiscus sabdariffa]
MGSYGASSGVNQSAAVSEVSGSKEASSTASSTKSAASGGAKGLCGTSATAAATGTEGGGATEAAMAGATESESGPWALVESRLAGGLQRADSLSREHPYHLQQERLDHEAERPIALVGEHVAMHHIEAFALPPSG